MRLAADYHGLLRLHVALFESMFRAVLQQESTIGRIEVAQEYFLFDDPNLSVVIARGDRIDKNVALYYWLR